MFAQDAGYAQPIQWISKAKEITWNSGQVKDKKSKETQLHHQKTNWDCGTAEGGSRKAETDASGVEEAKEKSMFSETIQQFKQIVLITY